MQSIAQYFSQRCKKTSRSSSPQQAACWHNNVDSHFIVDATLTINSKLPVDIVAASKQAELLVLVFLHPLYCTLGMHTNCLVELYGSQAVNHNILVTVLQW